MSSNVNVVVCSGNLCADPELTATPSGSSVCKLRVAVNESVKDAASGEWKERANYFSVDVWGARGEACGKYLHKGDRVTIDGRLRWRSWEAEDGKKREAVSITAHNVEWPPKGESAKPAGDAFSQAKDIAKDAQAAPDDDPFDDGDSIPF